MSDKACIVCCAEDVELTPFTKSGRCTNCGRFHAEVGYYCSESNYLGGNEVFYICNACQSVHPNESIGDHSPHLIVQLIRSIIREELNKLRG